MTLADPRQRRMWSADELQRILKAADNAAGYFDNRIRRSLFLRSWVLVTQETELTYCQLTGLTRQNLIGWNCISCDRRYHTVSWDTHEAIDATFPPRRELLFPWPYSRRNWYDAITRMLMEPSGIPVHRRFPCFDKEKRYAVAGLRKSLRRHE